MFGFGKKKYESENETVKECLTCQHSKLQDGKYICKYKGEVDRFFSCRKYRYDITKRSPKGIDPRKIAELSEDIADLLK